MELHNDPYVRCRAVLASLHEAQATLKHANAIRRAAAAAKKRLRTEFYSLLAELPREEGFDEGDE